MPIHFNLIYIITKKPIQSYQLKKLLKLEQISAKRQKRIKKFNI